MSRLPALSGRQLVAALERLGFHIIRTKGSHWFLRHSDGRATVVPAHSGETVGRGLMAKILRDTELTADELRSAL
ncbi:MAG: type II toxin-antitoxin system HicA family toxin [Spirochaetaceae bacterium]|nr:type II toxin-antitoxin system HicA family toxin [Spirochaetaceae bacterium]